jgi:hypothetical protein
VGLITLEQVRAEGLDTTAAPDARVLAAIETWSGFIEQQCRQPFSPKVRTITLDGNNSDTMFLPWPILALRSVYLNGDFVNALGAENYRAYMGVDFPDDRKNPKLQLVSQVEGGWRQAYYLGRNRRPFARGKQNQRLVGVFGYCDPSDPIDVAGVTAASPMVVTTAAPHGLATGDWVRLDDVGGVAAANYVWKVTVVDATHVSLNGSAGAGEPGYTSGGALRKLTTPALIQRAVMKLVLTKTEPLATSDEAKTPGPAGFEMTDGHSIQYLTPEKFKNRAMSLGITKDPEVEQIIAMFRAPAKMRAPGTMSFQDAL